MSKASRLFLGDHLIQSLCSFSDISRKRDDTVMRKVKGIVTYVRSDKKKLAKMFVSERFTARLTGWLKKSRQR